MSVIMNNAEWNLKGNDDAFSPRIFMLVFLIIGISIPVAMILIYDYGHTWQETPTPKVEMEIKQDDDANFTISVTRVDGTYTGLRYVRFILIDDRGEEVPSEIGNTSAISGKDISHENVNISYQDNDNDENISQGDEYTIKHKDFGGAAEAGYSLLLKHEVTGNKMNGWGTKLI